MIKAKSLCCHANVDAIRTLMHAPSTIYVVQLLRLRPPPQLPIIAPHMQLLLELCMHLFTYFIIYLLLNRARSTNKTPSNSLNENRVRLC